VNDTGATQREHLQAIKEETSTYLN
jgi:hypothetical protein